MAFESEKLLDNVGWQILQALQENARFSFADLGRRVGLSPPAVAERVRRMEEAGIITGYHAAINLERAGRPIHAFIRISQPGVKCTPLYELVNKLPEVLEFHRATGSECYIIKVAARSVSHLETLIDQLAPSGQVSVSIVLSSCLTNQIVEPMCDSVCNG